MIKQPKIEMIPVDKIKILNPRSRGKKKYDEIVASIADVGLKRPITVSRRIENKGDTGFDLVCGQGRLEAYIYLGQTEVPAIVISVSREQRLLMSLVENVARRSPTTLDHVKQIGILRDRGYTIAQIGKKIGMSKSQVGGLVTLLDHGEARLLQEVEWENIPIGIAVMIATATDEDVQRSLTEAFEKKQLLAKDVSRARKIVEKRKLYGKSYGVPNLYKKKMQTSESVMRAYNREAQRQKLLVKKAKLCETRLLFISSALRMLFSNESFVNLLRAEKLDTLPQYLEESLRR